MCERDTRDIPQTPVSQKDVKIDGQNPEVADLSKTIPEKKDGVICQRKNEFTSIKLVISSKTNPITFWSKHMIKDMIKKHFIVKEI